MSVNVPKMHSHIDNPYGDDNGAVVYSYLASNSEMDATLLAMEGLVEKLLRLAEVEKSCQLMADEIEKTRRRVNGLEYSTIPQLEETIHYIELKLEEAERANLVRIMKVK
jgi:V/A-type H+-transporting ATPase subunit D